MKAYKLMRLRKDGTLGSLFINRRAVIPVGEWLEAEPHRTRGYAYRPGWHCTFQPHAPHLSENGRVWVEVDVDSFTVYPRPESQGGEWVLAKRMKIVNVMEPSHSQA